MNVLPHSQTMLTKNALQIVLLLQTCPCLPGPFCGWYDCLRSAFTFVRLRAILNKNNQSMRINTVN